jgi:4-hydroxythreonine-4-phosphate dehydrogenase
VSESSPIQRIALTPGEPAGIGPDVVVRLAQRHHPAELVAFCDPTVLLERAEAIGLPLAIEAFEVERAPRPHTPGRLCVEPVSLAAPVQLGQVDTANASYVLSCLRAAVRACLDGACSALVTGPVHKAVINDADIAFTGHTELIGELTGGNPVMMLVAGHLRVVLVTTHLPLSAVPGAITDSRLTRVLEITHADLRGRFGIPEPRIAVCGLNPHAGEGGYLGSEEIEIIGPVLEQLRSRGLRLYGPLPADTAFTPRHLQDKDAVVAMYHDQGLPVLKHAGFGQAVNVTLGLPIIRTSVDHGTALDIAGTDRVEVGSLQAALDLAIELGAHHRVSGSQGTAP